MPKQIEWPLESLDSAPPACPGGVFVGPSDVGGTCPQGTETRTVTDTVNRAMDHCCCKIDHCCWAKCVSVSPPDNCLPSGAKWKFNATLAGHYQAVLAGLWMKYLTHGIFCITSHPIDEITTVTTTTVTTTTTTTTTTSTTTTC